DNAGLRYKGSYTEHHCPQGKRAWHQRVEPATVREVTCCCHELSPLKYVVTTYGTRIVIAALTPLEPTDSAQTQQHRPDQQNDAGREVKCAVDKRCSETITQGCRGQVLNDDAAGEFSYRKDHPA